MFVRKMGGHEKATFIITSKEKTKNKKIIFSWQECPFPFECKMFL